MSATATATFHVDRDGDEPGVVHEVGGDTFGRVSRTHAGRWTRPWGAAISLVMLAAVAWPLDRAPLRGDDFPLSTYPMFALRRKNARVVISYVIATGPEERRRHVPPHLVAGPEVMQAMMTVQRAVGRGHAGVLCKEVAARLATRRGYDAFTEVQVVTGDHRAVEYLTRGVRGKETLKAACPIARATP